MSVAFESGPQLEVVEDLPVLNDADCPVGGEHRLISVLEIDDCQAARGQPDGAIDVAPVGIGSPVDEGCVHTLEQRPVCFATVREVVAAADSAHRLRLRSD